LLDSAKSQNHSGLWMMNGGWGTLNSFNIASVDEMHTKYVDFFNQTKLFWETSEFIAVHAGLNFNSENPLKDEESMLWIRDFPVNADYLNGKLLIHGHTPVSKDYISSQSIDNVVNIDGGCVYNLHQDMGNLVAYNFTEKQLLFQPNIEDI